MKQITTGERIMILKNALPGRYGEDLDTFEVISELIQNAHDAQWEEDGERRAETFRFDISSRSFLFVHDGRPPQFVRLGLNEVEKMTINSTSKHAQYSTEGQFGIGSNYGCIFSTNWNFHTGIAL